MKMPLFGACELITVNDDFLLEMAPVSSPAWTDAQVGFCIVFFSMHVLGAKRDGELSGLHSKLSTRISART